MMEQSTKTRQHFTSLCRMCDDHCGINVYVEDGRIVEIDGLREHPWNHGRLCIKGRLGVDFVNAPDRLRKPLKRSGAGWEEIPIGQALDEIAGKIRALQAHFGDRAMSVWKGEAIGFLTQEELARRFIHAIGSPNYFSNDSACFAGRYIGYSLVAGTWSGSLDYSNTRCMVFWGANPPHAHPNMTQSIMKARQNGAKLIVIDSRLSAIARQADEFIQLRPGTDGALALGIASELIANHWICRPFIENYAVGFEPYADYVKTFPPSRVEAETGVPAETVRRVARLIGQSAPKVIQYVGNGLEHHENGINNIRAVACLDGLVGNLDEDGGYFMPEGPGLRELTIYEERPLLDLAPIGADKYPVLYDFRQECHSMTGMDTILTGTPYPIKGMIITGANPALTNPNTDKVIRALKALDLLVVREVFMSETAKLADYVLPSATYLERSELHCHTGLQVLGLTQRVVSFPECQDEYTFWHDLAQRLGAGEWFPWESETELNRWRLEGTGVTLEQLAAHPEGVVYKPKRYHKYQEKKFNTPSGKFEFVSGYLRNYGYAYLPEYHPPAYLGKPNREYPFVLITGARQVVYLHSRNHNLKRPPSAVPHPEIEMHPEDAKKLGVKTGDVVSVTSTIGSVDIPVTVVPEHHILPGVVQVTHGWSEANINKITPDDINDPIDGFPLMKSVEVRIERK
ncbi:MAG TPA: molybdopterin-dependent oxidoreductase [Anaerolineales bacterium]|nr:molybdopterin-dependent oxidoreductase [Anaerolineales bacterium]